MGKPAFPNVYPSDHPHLSAYDLMERGWTETMIRRFLGPEDRRESVDHYANFQGARAWALDRVERAECTMEFEEFFIKSAKRRKLKEPFRGEVLRRIRKFRKEGRDLHPLLEASYRDRVIAAAAADIEKARRRGLRTPHKC